MAVCENAYAQETNRPTGTGTSVSPFCITTADELRWLADTVNSGISNPIYAVLTANIDMAGIDFVAIGHYDTTPFRGSFDGQGHTVSNLEIMSDTLYDSANLHREGLFGSINGATISNLILETSSVAGSQRVGGIVGTADKNSTIVNCQATDITVRGQLSAGAIAGALLNGSSIERCTSTRVNVCANHNVSAIVGYTSKKCAVTDSRATEFTLLTSGKTTGYGHLGGIVGNAVEGITLSRDTAISSTPIVLPENNYIGILAGLLSGAGTVVENCHGQGSIQGLSSLGALIGRLTGTSSSPATVNCCTAISPLVKGVSESSSNNIGGFIGYVSYANISDCSANTKEIEGYSYVGGLVGSLQSNSIIERSHILYETISASHTSSNKIGGLVGYAYNNAHIKNCSTIGESISGNSAIGGLAGAIDANSAISNSFTTSEVVSLSGSTQTGSLCGAMTGTIADCFTTAASPDLAYNQGGGCILRSQALPQTSLASGELCYRLNSNGNDEWRQTLTQDTHPTTDPSKPSVSISGTLSCNGQWNDQATFTNDESLTNTTPHQPNGHGYCSICQQPLPDGKPQTDGVYILASEEDLRWFADLVNLSDQYAYSNAKIEADITLTTPFVPIGNYAEQRATYRGTFNGQGHTISNLSLNNKKLDFQALFGRLESATILGVTLDNATIYGTNDVGTIAGYAYESNICDCHTTASCMATASGTALGGIVGHTDNTVSEHSLIENCTNRGNVEGNSQVGGIVGLTVANGTTKDQEIRHCENHGSISGANYVGGIVGYASSHTLVFGISTSNRTEYHHWTQCRNWGEILATNNYVGGIAGRFEATRLEHCYTWGNVVCSGSGTSLGTIAGSVATLASDITRCYCSPSQAALPVYGGRTNTSCVVDMIDADINADGTQDALDVQALTDMLTGKATASKNANVWGNLTFSIADITLLIYLLNKGFQ